MSFAALTIVNSALFWAVCQLYRYYHIRERWNHQLIALMVFIFGFEVYLFVDTCKRITGV